MGLSFYCPQLSTYCPMVMSWMCPMDCPKMCPKNPQKSPHTYPFGFSKWLGKRHVP